MRGPLQITPMPDRACERPLNLPKVVETHRTMFQLDGARFWTSLLEEEGAPPRPVTLAGAQWKDDRSLRDFCVAVVEELARAKGAA